MLATFTTGVLFAALIDIDGTFFIQLGVFLLIFLLLRRLVFNPVMKLFRAREEAIDGARAKARQLEQEAEAQSQAFDEEFKSVRNATQAQREQMRAEAQRLARELTEQSRAGTEASLRSARKRLEEERIRLRGSLSAKVPALAQQIAGRLLEREVQK